MKLTKNLGVITTLLFSIITSSGVMLMTPQILHNYGITIYILWSISSSIAALLFIADFGITSVASQKFLFFFKTSGIFPKTLWKSFVLFHSKILFLMSMILITIFSLQIYFDKNLEFTLNFLVIFLIIILSTLMSVISHQQIIKFQINNNYQRALNIITFTKLLETTLTLWLVFMGINFIIVCSSTFVLRYLQFKVLQRLSMRNFQSIMQIQDEYEEPKFVLRFFLGSILYSASSVLGIHATFLIQSIFMSPEQTLTLLVTRMLASPIRILADSIAIGNFDNFLKKSVLKLGSNSSREEKILVPELWTLVFFTLPFMLIANTFANIFVTFLSHGQLRANFLLLNLYCISTLLDGMIVIYMQLRISKGLQSKIGVTYLGTTTLGFSFLLIFGQILGLYAGVTSIILCNLVFTVIALRKGVKD